MSAKNNMGFFWVCFTSHFDQSKKYTPLSKPIKCKTKINRDLVARFFRLSVSLLGFTLSFHGLPKAAVGFCGYFGFGFTTLNRKPLYNSGMHLFCITSLCYFSENHTTFTTNQMPVKLKPWLFFMMTSFTENPRQASFPPAKNC